MSDVDEIKSRASIVEYITSYVKLAKAGKNFKGLCPFHGEKTPSFMVSPERGTFHCFGCGKGGSIFDFVMLYHNVDFREALELLAEYTGVELTRFSPVTNEDKLKEQLLDMHIKAVEYYEYLYTTHPLGKKAKEYLTSRGVSEKVRKTFGIGYSANSWDGLKMYLLKKGFSEESIIKSGLTIASSHGSYDRFRGRLMFPQRDYRGRVVGFSGRLLEQDVKEAKYINTSETILYSKSNILYGLDSTKDAIKKADSVILVEGEFDVISLFQNGISNVVGIKGSALTEGHIRLIKRFTQTLYFCLDSDIAGDTASRRGILLADAAGCDMKVITTSAGKDPDEAVKEDKGLFVKAIASAEPIYDFLISSSVKRHGLSDVTSKKNIGNELFPILGSIENAIVQAHYVKKLARILEVSEEVIGGGIRKALRAQAQVLQGARSHQPIEETSVKKSRLLLLEMHLLALTLQGNTKELIEEYVDQLPLNELGNSPVARMFALLQNYIASERIFFLSDFGKTVPNELVSVYDEALLMDLSDISEDESALITEWLRTKTELEKEMLRIRLLTLSTKLSNQSIPVEEQESISREIANLTLKRKTLESG